MPIYEYRCEACKHQLEALQRFSDAPLTTCPSCGAPALKKMLSAAGFQLKGSGWYATDFRNSGSKPAKKDSTKPEGASSESSSGPDGAAAKSDGKSEGKSEGKPEAAKPEPAKPVTTAGGGSSSEG